MSDAAIRCDPAPMAELHAISTSLEFSVVIPCKLTGLGLFLNPKVGEKNYLDMLGSRTLGQGCSA